MANQTILWTALPNGFSPDGNSLRISLLAAPRLELAGEGKLGDFPDFVDWPATLARSRFIVHYGANPDVVIAGNDFVGLTRIDDRLGLPDSNIWQTLFPKSTLVIGYFYRDLTNHSVLSYPAGDMDKLVRDLYSGLAASPTDQLPTAETFLTNPAWIRLLNVVARLDHQFTNEKNGLRDTRQQFAAFKNRMFDPPHSESDEVKMAAHLARFQLFHTPPSKPKLEKYQNAKPGDAKSFAEWQGYERAELPQPGDFKKKIDFHQMVAAMHQYPTLMRRLGLVIDLSVARDAFSSSPDALLWAEVKLPQGAPSAGSPRTHARLDANRFQAVPRVPAPDLRVRDGLLDLDKKTFALLQSDVDGATMKVTNFARTLLTLRDQADHRVDPVTKHPREVGAPAVRNAGLMLVQNKRADSLKQAIDRQDGFNTQAKAAQNPPPPPAPAPPPPNMNAEDLVRGYRIDIWEDVSKRWHSLCKREAIYDIADGAAVINVTEEEGTVKLAATTSPDQTSNPDIIWLDEALDSWTGWSLCAPPPGKTIHHRATKIDEHGNEVTVHDDPVEDAEAEVPPGLRLKPTFRAAAGSLPRLRYGRRYWLRARVVDLAGNSLELQPKDFGPEQSRDNAQSYFRYEPISAPAFALVKPTPATTEEPKEGESMERMAIRSFNEKPPMNTWPSIQRARRFAVAPRTTQREAEQHGVLDRAGAVDASFFAMLAAKDNSLQQENIKTAGPLAGGPPVETGYAVMTDGEELPYLPDPLAVRIAARIFDHPGFSPDQIITIPFYDGSEWPDALPFKIEIYEKPGDVPRFDSASRTLFIPLPKAVRATLRLSVAPTSEALKILGVWNWLTAAQQAQTVIVNGRPMTVEKLAHRGQHWMLTPWRNIELVHAVQRPLLTPDFKRFRVDRSYSETFAIPRFVATCSIASTDRIDLRAAWNEPRDNVQDSQLENVSRLDNAFSIKITDDKSYGDVHEYHLDSPDVVDVNGDFHEQRGKRKVHEFHDTRYRRIKYWLEGTTKFREFLPANLLTKTVGGQTQPTEERINVIGEEMTTWIPSSAPPPAPEVLYVLPTFGWVRSEDETSKKSWRRGGGLRVYLNRPWNVSGYGEMLAVVLPPANFPGDPNKEPPPTTLKKFVTQWGNDPIWLSPFVAGVAPKRNNFPLARTSRDPDGKWLPGFAPADEWEQPPGPFRSSLQPSELRTEANAPFVEIAPHDVFYDEERQLWYCDIEVTWGAAYFPFIRLALARYQPVSVDTAHLSNIVIADFMPLVPDRWLSVSGTRDARTKRVLVFGNTYEDSSGHREAHGQPGAAAVTPSSVVSVWLERLEPSLGEDFGWQRESRAIIQRDNEKASPGPITAGRLRAMDLVRHREFEALIDESLIDRVFITPTLWQGSVTLPESRDPGARYRLVIAEYEEYLVDDNKPYEAPATKKGRRLVFVEHIELQ